MIEINCLKTTTSTIITSWRIRAKNSKWSSNDWCNTIYCNNSRWSSNFFTNFNRFFSFFIIIFFIFFIFRSKSRCHIFKWSRVRIVCESRAIWLDFYSERLKFFMYIKLSIVRMNQFSTDVKSRQWTFIYLFIYR
jgi:hypothetical protein